MSATRILLFIQLFFCLPLFAVQQPPDGKFILIGKINGNAPKQIRIGYIDSAGRGQSDSTQVNQGKFEFKGVINGPTTAFIIGKTTTRLFNDPNRTTIYLEPGRMEIELTVDHFQSAIVKGSRTQNDYHKLNMIDDALDAERKMVTKAIDSLNKSIALQGNLKYLQAQVDNLNTKRLAYPKLITENRRKFVRENGASAVTAYLMAGMIYDETIPLDSAEMIYSKFPEAVKNSALGIKVAATIKGKRALVMGVVGKQAPLINALDINGNRYVLKTISEKNICC